MKILYLTDTHDMGRNPGARIDDYHGAILNKFDEAFKVAIKEKVDAVVHGGDWFHYPKVANTIYNQHQRKLRKLRKKKIPVYVVPGNHDLYGYSLDTIDQTSLGSFMHAGLVKLLTRDKSYMIDDGQVKVSIHGREYSIDIDDDPTKDYQINVNTKADFNFLFSHGMLLDKPFHPDVKCTLTKDVITDADYVFNGHYHPGWKTHSIHHTTFVNIGSTGRDEGSVDNIKRKPKYAIIEVTPNGVHIDVREYKCAQEGKDVFDRTQIIQKKEHMRYLESFEQTVQDTLAYEAFDPKDIIKNTKGIDKNILNEALQRIVEEEQKMHNDKLQGYVIKNKPIGIKYVELENFQSHKKTRIDFNEKGLNTITGASDSGKSAIIRAIRWCLQNEPKGTDFIRNGANRVTVTVGFTDGSSITRSRTKSSAGEYIIRDGNGNETTFKGFGNHIPIDIVNVHQMPKVELSPGFEKSLNFSFQLDGHFLLSESPSTRAAVIGRLIGVHLVDDAIKEISKEIRQLTIATNASEKQIETIEEKLRAYDDLPMMEQKLLAIQGLIQSAQYVEKKIEELSSLYKTYKKETKMVSTLKKELTPYQYVDNGIIRIELAENKLKELNQLKNDLTIYKRYTNEINHLKKELNQYERVHDGIEQLKNMELLQQEILNLKSMLKDYDTANQEMKNIEHELMNYKELSKMKSIDHLELLQQEIKQLKELEETYIKHDKTMQVIEHRLKETTEKIEEIQSRMKELINQMGTCPMCHQPIDEHIGMEMLDHV